MNQKKSEHTKMVEFFEEQEDVQSTIYKKTEEDESQFFMSFESYIKIAL